MAAAPLTRRVLFWLFILTAVALALRLYRIDWQSMLFDENFSMMLADRPLPDMMTGIIRDAVHPPLHYLVLWSWVRLFGFDQYQARLISVLFGVLSIPMMFLVGRRLLNPRAGLISAGLLCVSQFAVHHSQEGRMYAMAFFLVLCALFFYVRTLQDQRWQDWVLFLLFSALMLNTNYYTFTVLFACAAFALLYRKQYPMPLWWLMATPIILSLAVAPWITSGVIPALAARGNTIRDAGLYMRFEWTKVISSLNWFNSGKWNGMYLMSPWWSLPAGLLLFTAPALLALKPIRQRLPLLREAEHAPGSTVLLLLLWAFPMLTVALISWSTRTQFDVRYTVYGFAGYLLLAGFGFDSVRPTMLRVVALTAALVYSAASLYAVYYIQFKEDYRGASRYVTSHLAKGDCLCFQPAPRTLAIPEYWLVQARTHQDVPLVPYERLTDGNYPCTRVWMLWDGRRQVTRKDRQGRLDGFLKTTRSPTSRGFGDWM